MRVRFLAGKFAGFDAAIALAGDVDGEYGMLDKCIGIVHRVPGRMLVLFGRQRASREKDSIGGSYDKGTKVRPGTLTLIKMYEGRVSFAKDLRASAV